MNSFTAGDKSVSCLQPHHARLSAMFNAKRHVGLGIEKQPLRISEFSLSSLTKLLGPITDPSKMNEIYRAERGSTSPRKARNRAFGSWPVSTLLLA